MVKNLSKNVVTDRRILSFLEIRRVYVKFFMAKGFMCSESATGESQFVASVWDNIRSLFYWAVFFFFATYGHLWIKYS